MPQPVISMSGKQLGDLTVLTPLRKRASNGGVIWRCRCVCNRVTKVAGGDLRKWQPPQILSCGCRSAEGGHKNKTHGLTESPEYRAWSAMWDRCTRKNNPAYKDYGGRGITVCARWLKFENFYMDMGSRPAGMSLERKHNDKGYYKSNCVWATPRAQSQNRRSNVTLVFQGEAHCVAEWARRLGISRQSLHSRLRKMPLDQALRKERHVRM